MNKSVWFYGVVLGSAAALALISANTFSATADRGVTGEMHGEGPGLGGCPPGPFGDNWIKLQENGLIDSYDSRVAPYDPLNPGLEANAGTNCNGPSAPWAIFDNNSTVKGDVSVASDSSLAIQTGTAQVLITGQLNYGCGEWELKPITGAPSYTQAGDTKIHGSYGSKPGSYEITDNNFIAYNNADVTFDPGTYHFANFELSNGTNFKVGAAEGIVELFIDSSIVFENNSELLPPIAFTGDTTKLRIYFNGTNTVDLSNNVEFYGFIYAPNAKIEVRNNDDVYGNLVGKEVFIWNNAAVHYDKALGAQEFGTVLGAPKPPPETTDWKEIIKSQ